MFVIFDYYIYNWYVYGDTHLFQIVVSILFVNNWYVTVYKFIIVNPMVPHE